MPPEVAKPVLSSIHDWSDETWNRAVEVVSAADGTGWARWVLRVLLRSPGRLAFVFRGTSGFSDGYRDLFVAALVRRLHSRARVVMSDATIEPGSKALQARLPRWAAGLPQRLSRAMVRLVDGPNVVWCVLSTGEIDTFTATWGVPRERVVRTLFTHTLHTHDLVDVPPLGNYLFSGGNSLRDYRLLLDALEGVDVELRVASSWAPDPSHARSSSFRATSHEEFLRLLEGCRALVLPLEAATRSTGQQTCLNAMALGKIVIVNDAPGVRDYVVHGVTGIVVAGTAAMRAAVLDFLEPANSTRYEAIGAAAREWVLNDLTPDHYRRRLLRVALGDQPSESADLGRGAGFQLPRPRGQAASLQNHPTSP